MRGFKIVLIVIFAAVLVVFKVAKSEFICNPSVCKVVNKSLIGITRSTYKVNLDDIDKFDSRVHFSMFSSSRERRDPEYDIYAHTKSGYSYKFFGSSHSYSYADVTTRQLNEALKNKNTNIHIIF